MKIVFSFDDGRDDAYIAADILYKHGLKGSFHITTGFIDGSFKTDAFGVNRKPLLIDEIKKMNQMGMDISLHGDRHIMQIDDFNTSVEKLKRWGIEKSAYGFSVPNSSFNNKDLDAFCRNIKNLKYVRVGRNEKCYTIFNKINYVFYHLFHNQTSFNLFNKSNLIYSFNINKIYSLVVKKDTRSKNIIKFIQKYGELDCTLVLMFHSIVDNPKNEWEYSLHSFNKIVKFISSSNLINVTTLDRLER